MALVLKDRVKQTAAAPGTGTITLGATAAGFQSFASVGNGNTTYYAIVDPVSGDWEVNYGVYTSSGTTLTRNATPLSSSTGTLVNFTGTVDVFLTYPSEKAVWQDLSGVVAQQSFGAITATSAALTTGTITGAPVNATDIVNKEYADSIASGLNYHQPVNYASTAALPAYTYNNGSSGIGATITANANGALSLGGGSPTATQRVLVKDEVSGNAPYNGVYVVTQAGSAGTPFILTRASDYDTSGTGTNEIDQGDYVLVISGTLASTAWVQQTPLPITVGTTALTFLQFNAPITYTAGTGLNLSPATTFNISNTGVSASTYGSASAVPVFAVNAQGQITSVTNTNIAINGSQVSGNISGQAGSVANALTLGTYLTGGTYNGSAAVTATVDATSANTASKVVARDSSGNFSAGTITATLNGTATSTASATNLSGGAANQIAYQSAANTTAFATAPSASNQVLNWNGSAFTWSAGTISGIPLGSNLNSLTAGTYLTGTAYNGSAAQTWTVDATSANTASKVVARDASGNFSAGTITAALSGNATTATTASDSNLLGGKPAQDSTGANTIPTRTGDGYTYLYYINSNTANNENPTISQFIVTNGGDNFYRKASSASVISQLGLLTTSNYNSYAPTLTGTGASGTWNISITGSSGSTSGNSATTSQRAFSGDISTTGQGRFTGWYTGNAATGFAVEAGISSGEGYIIPYNRDTNTYGALNIQASGVGMRWSGSVISVDSGYLQSNTSLRAPIFYDSNDTSYYVDPNGVSRLNRLLVYGGDSTNPTLQLQASVYPMLDIYSDDTNGNNRNWRLAGVFNSYGLFQILSSTAPNGTPSTARLGINGINGYVGIGAAATGPTNWLQIGSVGSTGYSGNHIVVGDGTYVFAQYLNGGTSMDFYTTSGYFNFANAYTQMAGSSRAPIFYDSNDTSYYVDPNSVSSQSSILIGYNAGLVYNVASTGYLTFGSTSDTGNYSIKTVLENYNGTYSKLSLYWYTGIRHYASQVYGGHRFYDIDGTQYFGIGVGGNWSYSIYSHRAPIFYDLDNTGYYLDPSSGSYLYSLSLSGNAYFQPNSWIQFNGNYGIYSTAYNGAHFLANAQSSYGAWRMIGSRNSYAGIYDDYSGVTTGMFDSAGNGGFYREANGRWYQYHNVSNNCTGFGTSTTASGYDIYCGTGIYSGGRVDGTIFYDSNNTSYYCDPSSTNSFNTTYTNVLYSYGNVTAYYSSDIKFKTNVRDISNAIETVESIGGKLFDWTDEYLEEHGGEDPYFMRKEDFGVVAQDVLKVFPVAVRTRPDGSLAVDYEKLSALAFAAVAELSTRVKSLEARI